jgi:hypothetical protein
VKQFLGDSRSSDEPILVQTPGSNRWILICDAVGLAAVGIQFYLLLVWLVPNEDGSRLIVWILGYILLAGLALYFWHKEPGPNVPTEPNEWAGMIGASIVMGGLSFGIDMLVGLMNHPKLSPIEAGTHAGSPFGFPLTLMICPGFTMIAVAGLLRAAMLSSVKEPT